MKVKVNCTFECKKDFETYVVGVLVEHRVAVDDFSDLTAFVECEAMLMKPDWSVVGQSVL
jgi:hypothetical protein